MIKCTFENGHETSLRHVVVDTLVLRENEILLVKRAGKLSEGGKWGLVGGYVDRDETIKEAVAREVREETGYEVSDITLLTIRDNPDRPKEDRQNVAFVFFCLAGEQVSEPDWESDDVRWFSLDALPALEEIAFDHYHNIELYIRFLRGEVQASNLL